MQHRNVFHLADDDEVYARGKSQFRIPAGFRQALGKEGIWGATRLFEALFVARAKEPRWWSNARRCPACVRAAPLKRALDVVEFDLLVRVDAGPVMTRLLTPGFVCRCGERSYVLNEEVRELASDVLVCCDFGRSGVRPNDGDTRALRRAQVRRIQ